MGPLLIGSDTERTNVFTAFIEANNVSASNFRDVILEHLSNDVDSRKYVSSSRKMQRSREPNMLLKSSRSSAFPLRTICHFIFAYRSFLGSYLQLQSAGAVGLPALSQNHLLLQVVGKTQFQHFTYLIPKNGIKSCTFPSSKLRPIKSPTFSVRPNSLASNDIP